MCTQLLTNILNHWHCLISSHPIPWSSPPSFPFVPLPSPSSISPLLQLTIPNPNTYATKLIQPQITTTTTRERGTCSSINCSTSKHVLYSLITMLQIYLNFMNGGYAVWPVKVTTRFTKEGGEEVTAEYYTVKVLSLPPHLSKTVKLTR